MQIDLDLFVCFAAVAEEMSFRKAAEKLSKDQSWLSRRVRKLEEYLGVRLFERNTRHVALTADGRALLSRAQAMESGARAIGDWLEAGRPDILRRAIAEKRRLLAGHFPRHVPRAADDAIRARHPNIHLPRSAMGW